MKLQVFTTCNISVMLKAECLSSISGTVRSGANNVILNHINKPEESSFLTHCISPQRATFSGCFFVQISWSCPQPTHLHQFLMSEKLPTLNQDHNLLPASLLDQHRHHLLKEAYLTSNQRISSV